MRTVRNLLLSFPLAGVLACAGTPLEPPVNVSAIAPGSGERVAVDHALVLIDTSSSVSGSKRVAQSFIAGMPSGGYQAGALNFGGYEREVLELGRYDRGKLAGYANELSDLNEGTPIHKALAEASTALEGKGGRAALVLVSDGLPTDEIGREISPQLALQAARDLSERHGGKVCLHTIQVGNAPAGESFLKSLSQAAGCGTYRNDAALGTESAYHALERDVFIAAAQTPPPALPAVSARAGDADQDGVLDDRDQCRGTLRGAPVDSRGCWTLPGLTFATDSVAIGSEGRSRLNEVLPVLRSNPDVRIRIEGHTDNRGSASYNQALSERRANAVRRHLVDQGISADRLVATGMGETRPAAPNDTSENLRRNRRIELSVVQ